MKYIIYVLLMILDILLFVFLFIYEEYLLPILILHIIIYTISWKLYITFKFTTDAIPYSIILFMPILGILILYSFIFSINHFFSDNEIISDYEKMLLGSDTKTRSRKVDYAKEIKTMSYLDLLPYIDPEKKKEILIDSETTLKRNNAIILKKALESDDKEVQHYSATLLNSSENELINNISYLRDKFNETDNDKFLDQLAQAYKDYLDSSLIESDSINIFRKEYIDVLNKKLTRGTYSINTLTKLVDTYLEIKDIYNANIMNQKIKDEFGENDNYKINKLNIFFEEKDFSQINKYLNSLDENDFNNNNKLKEIKDFFKKEA